MSQMIESFLHPAQGAGLRAQPVELQEPPPGSHAGDPLVRDPHPLHAVKLKLQVRVGECAMTIAQLLEARENQVLVLDRCIDHPVELVVEGAVVARGELVAVDGCFAVRISELPLPLRF